MMKPFNRISSLKKITCFFMHLINCKRDRCIYVDIEKKMTMLMCQMERKADIEEEKKKRPLDIIVF